MKRRLTVLVVSSALALTTLASSAGASTGIASKTMRDFHALESARTTLVNHLLSGTANLPATLGSCRHFLSESKNFKRDNRLNDTLINHDVNVVSTLAQALSRTCLMQEPHIDEFFAQLQELHTAMAEFPGVINLYQPR